MKHSMNVKEDKASDYTVDMSTLERTLECSDSLQQKVVSMYIVGYELNDIAHECKISVEDVENIVDVFVREVL